MSESLMQKVEEKILLLLAEVDFMRNEIQTLRHENINLKNAHNNHARKLQGLVALLDALGKETV